MVARMRRAAAAAFLAAAAIGPFAASVSADEAAGADRLLKEVDAAVSEESYTKAIALLEEGKETWPGDHRIPMRAGELYKERELYRLALAEFSAAESLAPDDTDILYEIAETYGYLGNNTASVETFEKLLANTDAGEFRSLVVSDLSWMYFKTYRMQEGISLLESALAEGFDRNLAHTLGTLYSGVYEREKSREWYERAIEDALDHGDDYFASVAHYNLALLEFSSYRYDEAREEALRSLELQSRAGGHMVVGEIDMMAWDLPSALESFRKAEAMDRTPLSRVDMASFYRRIGRLDEAIRFAEEIAGNPDVSWMYHFGVDDVRLGMDLAEIFAESWSGKAETEALTPRAGAANRIRSLRNRIVWRAKARYHDRIYRRLGRWYAAELERNGNELDAAWNAFRAARGYRGITLVRLDEARALETAIAAAAGPWYDLETGWETRNPAVLLQALDAFSPAEGDPRERALRGLSGGIGERIPSAVEAESLAALYGMNPGGLRQYGLSLPVELTVTGPGRTGTRRGISILLRRSGYDVRGQGRAGASAAALTVTLSDGGCAWFLAGPDGRTRASAETDGPPRRRVAASILAELLDGLYRTPLDAPADGGTGGSGGSGGGNSAAGSRPGTIP